MHEPAPNTVVIGHFEDLILRGLRGLIEDDARLQLVANDVAYERLPLLLAAREPDVAILNFGSLTSPFDVRELSSQHPHTHLVLLANHPSTAECAQLLAFGASACMSKGTQARDILHAIHLASRGMQLIPREPSGAHAVASELLTLRESEVLAHLQRRRANAQIAADLHISVETVRSHARNIYRKLGIASRRDLLTPAVLQAVDSRPQSRPPLRVLSRSRGRELAAR
jgi:DNA-binding NarL/FixJ family response regulator